MTNKSTSINEPVQNTSTSNPLLNASSNTMSIALSNCCLENSNSLASPPTPPTQFGLDTPPNTPNTPHTQTSVLALHPPNTPRISRSVWGCVWRASSTRQTHRESPGPCWGCVWRAHVGAPLLLTNVAPGRRWLPAAGLLVECHA